jgi:hypothetical protein
VDIWRVVDIWRCTMRFPASFDACKQANAQRFISGAILCFLFRVNCSPCCQPLWKFGALNPRINKISFGGNWSKAVPQVQTSTFCIPTISWLSHWTWIPPSHNVSYCIRDQHGPSWTAVYMFTSQLLVIDHWAWTETKSGKFMKEYVSLVLLLSTIFTAALGTRKDSSKQPAVHPIMQQPQTSK